MNACPGEENLLRFLDGELGVQEDAWLVVHVEECTGCQERLERLTRGRPVDCEALTVDTIHADHGRAVIPASTEIDGWNASARESVGCDRAGAGGSAIAGFDPCSTQELGWEDTPGGVGEATESTREGASWVADPQWTVTVATAGPALRPEPAPERPFIPGYEILQRLGEGGMGVIYKARHRGLNRLVALKMIRGGSQARSDYFTRFRLEAESVARLRHPNILQIYDIGTSGGLPFVALELLDGGSLDHRLAHNPQPGRQAAELVATLARAIDVAHAAGIIHRDLKPANVLYTSDGVPKITDFGLAKRIDSEDGQTQSGQIMGTPSYMAPEQARGHSRNVGPAADVYALGAILYEMLTGRPPFKGETPMETVRQVIDDDPVTPSRLVPRLPRDLETICLKCLYKDPARRYTTAQTLADDLERYLEGKPIAARRTPPWERAAKSARRRPAAAAAIVVGIVFVAGVLGGLFARQNALLARSGKTVVALAGGPPLEHQADAARSSGELTDVKLRITAFLSRLKGLDDDPRINDLSRRLVAKNEQIDARLHRLEFLAEQERIASERQRLRDFEERRYLALFHAPEFSDLDLPASPDATRREALAALGLWAAPGAADSWSLATLPASLSPTEHTEITEGCYELLLLLSQTEATPALGLRRLEQAARLHSGPTRAYHLRRAACLERAGDRPAAEEERRSAARQAVTTALDHYLAGKELYQEHHPLDALGHFNQSLRQQPDHFWAQCLAAFCWLKLNHPESAQAGFAACLKREPGFAWLYILRGYAFTRGLETARPAEMPLQFEEAEADYRRALELLESKPSDELRYIALVNRGVLRSRRGLLDLAAADLKAAVSLGDQQSMASAGLGDVYRKQGRYPDAIEQFNRAIERRPDWAPLYRARADVVLESSTSTAARRAQALADVDRAIRLEQPDNPVLARDHANRARLLALEGNLNGALAACDAAIQCVGDYSDAHSLRLDLLLKLKRHDDELRSYDALIARGKKSATIFERRALAREAIRDLPGAIDDFSSALNLGGDQPRLRRNRGWLYIVADAPLLAWHDFQEVIRLDPSNADAYTGRGLARLRMGEHVEATADAENAITLGEPTADLFYKAARVYSLAAVVVSAKVRQRGKDSVDLVSRYQDRAASLVHEAIRRLPAGRRASFVKDVVLVDPNMRTLRRRLSSLELAGPAPSPAASAAAPSH